MDALVLHGVEESVCDLVGQAAIDEHDDAVQLQHLGSLLLRVGVPPVLAIHVVHNLVQVGAFSCAICCACMFGIVWASLSVVHRLICRTSYVCLCL